MTLPAASLGELSRHYPQDLDGVWRFLQDLTTWSLLSGPIAVAENLDSLDVKGPRACERICPLAIALAAVFPGCDPMVESDAIHVYGHLGWMVPPPDIADFIDDFDVGAFPQLDNAARPDTVPA